MYSNIAPYPNSTLSNNNLDFEIAIPIHNGAFKLLYFEINQESGFKNPLSSIQFLN